MKKLMLLIAALITALLISCTLFPCADCDGTGDCSICDGEGSFYSVPCIDCYGTGNCQTCNGTGTDI